eukprot:TRINITY_DN2491_c0_g1_i1.p1 TRINITY_DN2491_c0_g1~~TRINITY_DN2491_c0_g1_i1.p1  ORF type:complete len:163 (+),score=33.67 TRINITY_DN2491_c0_g1_i1:24-491(+)
MMSSPSLIVPPFLVLFLLLSSLAPSATASAMMAESLNCSKIVPDTCTFYTDCLEAQHPCGPKGYALGYGGKYCNLFVDHKFRTVNASRWCDHTLVCLQEALIPVFSFPSMPRPPIPTLLPYSPLFRPLSYRPPLPCPLPPPQLPRPVGHCLSNDG